MFGLLTICYLFLGGAGAGALVVLSLLECANARRRFGAAARDARVLLGASMAAPYARRSEGIDWQSEGRFRDRLLRRLAGRFALPDEFFARAWPVCFVMLALGILCLLFDVGRPDRILNLLFSLKISPVSVGAYALVVALLCATAFSGLALLDNAGAGVAMVRALGAVGAVAGVVAAAYTGVLLSGLASVLFWQTAWLPAVFLLSSLSCGIACTFLAAAFVEVRQVVVRPLRLLARVDSGVIVLEAMCLAGLLLHGFADEGACTAAEALVADEFKWVFWGGLVGLGLAVPLVMEQYVAHGNYSTQLLFVAVLVLLGGFVLRWCVACAAAYDVTQMPGELYGFAQALSDMG